MLYNICLYSNITLQYFKFEQDGNKQTSTANKDCLNTPLLSMLRLAFGRLGRRYVRTCGFVTNIYFYSFIIYDV